MSVNIAYLTVQMPAPSEVFLAVEINGLRAAGACVQVFALRQPHTAHERLVADQQLTQVPIHYFPLMGLTVAKDFLYWLRRRPKVVARIVAILLCSCWRRPVVLLGSLGIAPKSFSIARIIERECIPIVHTAWSHYPAITAYIIKELMPSTHLTMALGAYDRLARHPMTIITANRADYIFTQSQTLRTVIGQEFPQIKSPIVAIARGVDLSALEAHRTATAERTPGLVVTAGRLIEPKGHQYLIRAIAQVRSDIPHVHLKVFGQGEYRTELERLVRELGVQDAVEFAEHQPQSEMFAQIARAQVFVLASRSRTENLPNSVKEAMALAIPVITTPTTGIEELVQDGQTGYIVRADDVEALSNHIRRIVGDPDLANRVGNAAREHVQAVAGLAHSSATRMQIYTRLQEEPSTVNDQRYRATKEV